MNSKEEIYGNKSTNEEMKSKIKKQDVIWSTNWMYFFLLKFGERRFVSYKIFLWR